MAKTTVSKTAAVTVEPKVRKQRERKTALVRVTAAKLAQLIGDGEIGVSRKELNAFVCSSATATALANAGL